jgi:hypothetical protein
MPCLPRRKLSKFPRCGGWRVEYGRWVTQSLRSLTVGSAKPTPTLLLKQFLVLFRIETYDESLPDSHRRSSQIAARPNQVLQKFIVVRTILFEIKNDDFRALGRHQPVDAVQEL